MELRNKKTGEIIDLDIACLKAQFGGISLIPEPCVLGGDEYVYDSLAQLNEEWEDYEEPKEFYFIDQFMSVSKGVVDDVEYAGKHSAVNYAKKTSNNLKTAGNYFETKEEAELTLRKLKAWKRLKDKGFRFNYYIREHKEGSADITIVSHIDDDCGTTEDLYLLFSQEDD